MSLRSLPANIAFRIAMATLGKRAHARLMELAAQPAEAQAQALRNILQLCSATTRGRELGLDAIRSADDFRARVAISDYEDMREGVERQIATGEAIVTAETPIMYARTSGTTGKPKYIPVTNHVLAELREAQRAMSYVLHTKLHAFDGPILGLGGAAHEEQFASGAYAGATSGLIYATMPRFMRAKYVAPHEVFSVADYELKYRLIARMAVRHRDLSLIATANPSSVLRLMDVVRRDLAVMAEEVAAGGSALLADLPAADRAWAAPALRADPRRAAELRRLAGRTDLTLADIWPKLRCVATWLGGGCAIAAEAVRRQLPTGAAMADPGYVASEMRGTVSIDVDRQLALPLLGDVFFEFAPVADWEAGSRVTLLLHELAEGGDYHVIVTTAAGLVRYHMNDVVRVTGRIGATPTFGFVRKGRGVTSITGEKLSEDQVHAAIKALAERIGTSPTFYIATADVAAAHYRLRIEQPDGARLGDAEAGFIDRILGDLNIEYRGKRDSGRLGALQLAPLRRGAADAYHGHCVQNRGQREAQAKVLALQTEEELDFDFAPFYLP